MLNHLWHLTDFTKISPGLSQFIAVMLSLVEKTHSNLEILYFSRGMGPFVCLITQLAMNQPPGQFLQIPCQDEEKGLNTIWAQKDPLLAKNFCLGIGIRSACT